MKLLILIISTLIFSVNLYSQVNQLPNGFYRTTEDDSCMNSDKYIRITDQDKEYCIYKTPIVTDKNFQSIQVDPDTVGDPSNYIIGIKLDSAGTLKVKEATEKMVGKRAVFIISSRVAAAPIVQDPITSGRVAVFCDEETVKEIKRALKIKY